MVVCSKVESIGVNRRTKSPRSWTPSCQITPYIQIWGRLPKVGLGLCPGLLVPTSVLLQKTRSYALIDTTIIIPCACESISSLSLFWAAEHKKQPERQSLQEEHVRANSMTTIFNRFSTFDWTIVTNHHIVHTTQYSTGCEILR